MLTKIKVVHICMHEHEMYNYAYACNGAVWL